MHFFRSTLPRRSFLQKAAAFSLLPRTALAGMQQHSSGMSMPTPAAPSAPLLHSLELTPFVDPLPLPRAARPVTPPVTHPASNHGAHFRIGMKVIHTKVHRDVPATRMWVYHDLANPSATDTAVAPLIEARSHKPVQVEWVNNLPTQHFLPIDHSLHGCGKDVPDVRAIVHVHGARVPSDDDGHPDDWFVPTQSLTCNYPLQQDATALWYHDHAMGLNRLNVYAGMFGMMLVRDETEDALHLPTGKYELPLVLYDRNFYADGQLYYPDSGDPDHPWVSEFAGDAILINGKIRPYLEVEPALYRLRLVNAANSRFFRLSMSNKQPLVQIGSDQGLLSAPVELPAITFAPGERLDILLDLTYSAGQNLHLRHGAFDILQLRVAKATSQKAQPLPKSLRTITRIPESNSILTRTITLNEYQDKVGNSMEMLLNRKRWHEPVTEKPRLNSTEIWEFINMTEDVHPMHLHLVRFQVLDRRVYDTFAYLMHKELKFVSAAEAPAANEQGWKDVVQCPPGMVTRIIVKFEGFTGNYLYHCHILEHEANDMMRPFEVVA
ncbi:spore coat protein A [Granulicella aggregans]|uniref:Spore coat protein A n=1 Tax=Granulicella aggregans TaxID=474949 RepID=A0A7W8E383_9BACT|nr:multicopper oxidase domain-containing protein [Granulicella aggregans]MBB5057317.1 spore coat protein A [Granulicella aggregans]